MAQAKYQVFISSTYEDLKEERDQIIKAVLEMGHIPVGMEMFSAADEEQWKIIARQIDEVDYYVVLVAHKFGSVVLKENVSYTEKEYDYAVAQGVPVIGFVLDGKADWPGDRHETDSKKIKGLQRFRSKVMQKPVGFWTDAGDLHGKFAIALMKLIRDKPRPGWIKGDEVPGPEVTTELSRLSKENADLRELIAEMERNAGSVLASESHWLYSTTVLRLKGSYGFGGTEGFILRSTDFNEDVTVTWLAMLKSVAEEIFINPSEHAIESLISDLLVDTFSSQRSDLKGARLHGHLFSSINDIAIFLMTKDILEPITVRESNKRQWILTNKGKKLISELLSTSDAVGENLGL